MERQKKSGGSPIAWHPAFVEAIQMELDEYRDSLEFFPEYQLTSEPLRIDCVVIKKIRDVQIKKNIATMFREVNLIEYKSPDDYTSVEDFYKVYAYACLYASLEEVPVTSLTVSFIGSRKPRELFSHLKNTRGYKVEESSHGIYTVTGDILPIQIIDSRRLSADENLWLRDLCHGLDAHEMAAFFEEASRQGKAARIGTYLDVITRANTKNIKEELRMRKSQLSFIEVLEEIGANVEWEARGKEKETISIAKKMVSSGFPLETVASITELDPEIVRGLYNGG